MNTHFESWNPMIFGSKLQIMNLVQIKFSLYWCKGLEVWILMGLHFSFGDQKFKKFKEANMNQMMLD
jgi:hypothetical protein